MKLPTRKERELIRQKEEILTAAERIFSEQGFFTTKIQDIAKEAEFGIGTIYKHFKNKEAIFFTLLKNKFNEMLTFAEENVNSQTNPEEKMKALIRSHLEFFEKNKKIFRLMFAEHISYEKELRTKFMKEMRHKFSTYFKIFNKIYTEGMKKGLFRGESEKNIFNLCIALIGMLNFTAFYKLNNMPDESLLDNADLILTVFMQGVKNEK